MSFAKAFSAGERAHPRAGDALGGFLSGGWGGLACPLPQSTPVVCLLWLHGVWTTSRSGIPT